MRDNYRKRLKAEIGNEGNGFVTENSSRLKSVMKGGLFYQA